MSAYVYRPRRKNQSGKSVPEKNYRGRYRLEGDYKVTEIALHTSDKQVAQKRLKDIVREKEMEREGLIAPKLQRESADKLLLDHMRDYIRNLETLGRDDEYRNRLEVRIERLVKECKWRFAKDVTTDSFSNWRSKQTRFAPKTLNDHLDAISSLMNWMVESERIAANPIHKVKKVDKRGRQAKRRAFTDDEFEKLLTTANPNRRQVYLTAAYTGMRKGELIALVWGDCHLDGERPYISARAVTTKDSKDATIPLHVRLAAELINARPDDANDNTPVFPFMKDISHAIRRDIERAGLVRIDTMGRKLDFHALRYTFATKLAREGTSQRTTQELMRHSDPKMTAQIYTDASQLPTFDAVNSLSWADKKRECEDSDPPLISPLISPLPADVSGPLLSFADIFNEPAYAIEAVDLESFSLTLTHSDGFQNGVPTGIRTPVAGMKIQCPRPD
ncbi:hypothetical protein GCM10007047_34010 [Cerasicoccus arenae]|uniref:Tyr recombinase domain-containing protein n=1 Tax=Cerasicoccus arenae TaxID=424488 RepID=A0A8J3GGG4_9BACT|nr:hypothetical protein GCM10007047_34010 [Cerasicoccus arenae]